MIVHIFSDSTDPKRRAQLESQGRALMEQIESKLVQGGCRYDATLPCRETPTTVFIVPSGDRLAATTMCEAHGAIVVALAQNGPGHHVTPAVP